MLTFLHWSNRLNQHFLKSYRSWTQLGEFRRGNCSIFKKYFNNLDMWDVCVSYNMCVSKDPGGEQDVQTVRTQAGVRLGVLSLSTSSTEVSVWVRQLLWETKNNPRMRGWSERDHHGSTNNQPGGDTTCTFLCLHCIKALDQGQTGCQDVDWPRLCYVLG